MVDSGADVVLGHHPHVFQAVERYKHGLIFYSLGNFVFDCIWERDYTRSAIALIRLRKGEEIQYELVPVEINREYQPVPMAKEEGAAFLAHVEAISDKRYYDNYASVEDESFEYFREVSRCERRERRHKVAFVARNLFRIQSDVLHVLIWERLIKRLMGR